MQARIHRKLFSAGEFARMAPDTPSRRIRLARFRSSASMSVPCSPDQGHPNTGLPLIPDLLHASILEFSLGMPMYRKSLKIIGMGVVWALCAGALEPSARALQSPPIPRTAEGRPNLQGIWQVRNTAAVGLEDHGARYGMPAGRSVVVGGEIPYQDWALEERESNFANRETADPLASCYMPGVPRIMYLDFPFHIFQTPDHIAMTFEWSYVFRLIYTNGEPMPYPGLGFWMGDSRGRWEEDTLVVDVTSHNDRTWFDMSGNFHSDAMQLVERYTMLDANTIEYEVTVEDPEVFTRPWTIRMSLYRQTDMDRILEYYCQPEAEEASGDFERDTRTWYPGP